MNIEDIPQDYDVEDHHSSSDNDETTESSRPLSESPKPKQELAAVESKRIRIWRVIMVISILATGVAVSLLMFTLLNTNMNAEAKSAYGSFAKGVRDGFRATMESFKYTNNALSLAITSSALDHGAQFPFFAIPNFEVKAHGVRKEALFETVAFAPLVQYSELEQYFQFVNSTRGWLDESKIMYDKLEPGKNRSSEHSTPPIQATMNCVAHVEEKEHYSQVLASPCLIRSDWYLPLLQISPPPFPNQTYQNLDYFTAPAYTAISTAAREVSNVVFSHIDVDPRAFDLVFGDEIHSIQHTHPHTLTALPVFDNVGGGNVVGYVFGVVAWDKYMTGLLPEGVQGVILVLRNSCGQSQTYHLRGPEVDLLGEGDLHDTKYENDKITVDLADSYPNPDLARQTPGHCLIFLDVYPSDEFYQAYNSLLPLAISLTIACLFVVMAIIFGFYDRFVQTRNRKVVGVAERSNAIVSSLFPEAVKEKLLAEQQLDEDRSKKSNLKSFLANENSHEQQDENGMFKSKPIAELYPEATVLFADIVGFTAWSSVREPHQVFTLLETIYSAFDRIASQRRIYKVETIGDCYVAVCGLPQPRKDHAVAMARFARDCMYKMWTVTKMLESTLGPDTGELTLRIGLHSGPVTAGVLRGERSRFQLFGDTMNTAARIESTGKASCIHISQETADLLIAAGKVKWVTARQDKVYAKGKGELATFFLEMNRSQSNGSVHSGDETVSTAVETDQPKEIAIETKQAIPEKTARLIQWNFEVLSRPLKQIVARRRALFGDQKNGAEEFNDSALEFGSDQPFDQVKEIIEVSNRRWNLTNNDDLDAVDLDPQVSEQLYNFLESISHMYRDNPFHNFEHASHVTMSVTKLLSRIVAPSELDVGSGKKVTSDSLHDHTYGITSCPLTQFAVVLSAIIHDLDHPGVPNAQLVKEKTKISEKYKNVSVAEQNSVDLALHLLNDQKYKDLRRAIAATKEEMQSFRQLVINVVLATDICDKQLKELRNKRWNMAFSPDGLIEESPDQARNRKATIVIEHLIQASDVAHTMQHWHIYRKWNEKFFMECYAAYRMGRADTDPSLNWYKGEIGFFDFYIIPLARKLKECGVFGVSSDEYLNYAEKNRQEWVDRGEEVVNAMVEKARELWDAKK